MTYIRRGHYFSGTNQKSCRVYIMLTFYFLFSIQIFSCKMVVVVDDLSTEACKGHSRCEIKMRDKNA